MLREHITYSTHFLHQDINVSDDDDDLDILPLGSMQDALQVIGLFAFLLQYPDVVVMSAVKVTLELISQGEHNGSWRIIVTVDIVVNYDVLWSCLLSLKVKMSVDVTLHNKAILHFCFHGKLWASLDASECPKVSVSVAV